MLTDIKIDEDSSIPKYIQVTEKFLELIEKGELQLGDKLPSIKVAYKNLKISRDTLIKSYNELKARGVIDSKHGKGSYISNINTPRHLKIFVLFDVMNGYKSVLYSTLVKNLGETCSVDVFFHNYNLEIFENLISSKIGNYEYYIIMPHFNEDVSHIVRKVPANKLLLLDKDVAGLEINCSAVYQDFESDIYNSLTSGLKLIEKYGKLNMITTSEFQFIPDGLVNGFMKFTKDHKIDSGFIQSINVSNVHKGDAFIVFTDSDLVDLIKISHKKGLKLGSTIGIISYDDTPLKEVLANGITVISTDFKKMGDTASRIVLNRDRIKISNPCRLIVRNSL
jgi:DNA-binding transcriptional regulator YhcF (GntR family)